MAFVLSSCNENIKQGSIGSLAMQASVVNSEESVEYDVQQDESVIEYSRFIRLFDTVSNEAMRRDGMRKMAALQLQYDNSQTIPLSSVVLLFEKLIEDYPLQRNDMLIYQLSREYEESGKREAALNSLNRLVSQYPDTKYYDEAQFRRGEILFSKRQFIAAEQAYKEVVDYRKYDDKSIYYEQSVYKQGWSQFKQSNYYPALNSFMHLLDLHAFEGDLALKNMQSSEREFIEDIMRAINLSFSYQAGPVSAHEYFSKQQRRVYEYQIYASLARFYQQKNHYSDSVKTYQLFVSSNEMHPNSPRFLLEVVDIYEQGGFPDLLLDAKKDFVQRYNIKSPFWGLYESVEINDELQLLEKNIKQLASHYHALAQKTKSRLNYREAQRWYRIWLDSFPNDEKAWQMNFLYAEILNEDKRYESAVLQYENAAYDYVKHSKSAEAGFAALLMYANREAELQGIIKRQWRRQSIDSSIRFANEFPEHPEAGKVLTQSVENLYRLGEFEKAHQIGQEIVLSIKDPVLLVSAWTVMAHVEFEWRDFLNAEKSYSNALKYIPENDPARKSLLKKEAVAVYKQGELSRNKGDLKSAVKHFSRVKQVSSEIGLVANAEFDAASALIGLRDWSKAVLVLEGFRRTNTGHKLQPEVTKKLAVVYLEKGDIDNASIEFEKISYLQGDSSYQLEAYGSLLSYLSNREILNVLRIFILNLLNVFPIHWSVQ